MELMSQLLKKKKTISYLVQIICVCVLRWSKGITEIKTWCTELPWSAVFSVFQSGVCLSYYSTETRVWTMLTDVVLGRGLCWGLDWNGAESDVSPLMAARAGHLDRFGVNTWPGRWVEKLELTERSGAWEQRGWGRGGAPQTCSYKSDRLSMLSNSTSKIRVAPPGGERRDF